MEVHSLIRPMGRLLTNTTTSSIPSPVLSTTSTRRAAGVVASAFRSTTSSRNLVASSVRAHSTAARTKRALKIAPHDSFLPDRRPGSIPQSDTIIYNPPSSEASPHHTPFLFLPRGDPRRTALVRLHATNPDAISGLTRPSKTSSSSVDLPPELNRYHRTPQSHITQEGIDEMRRLRSEDPLKWSINRLAKKFDCSPVFVKIAAPAPAEHTKWLKEKLERTKARWGPIRTKARDDRKKRAEMVSRGEL